MQAKGADFADQRIDQSAGEAKAFFLRQTVADEMKIVQQFLAGAIRRQADGRGRVVELSRSRLQAQANA